MRSIEGIPNHVIQQVRRSLGRQGSGPDRKSINRLTHELRRLNGKLERLIKVEEKKEKRRQEREGNSSEEKNLLWRRIPLHLGLGRLKCSGGFFFCTGGSPMGMKEGRWWGDGLLRKNRCAKKRGDETTGGGYPIGVGREKRARFEAKPLNRTGAGATERPSPESTAGTQRRRVRTDLIAKFAQGHAPRHQHHFQVCGVG
jgi:hypothetical protein